MVFVTTHGALSACGSVVYNADGTFVVGLLFVFIVWVLY